LFADGDGRYPRVTLEEVRRAGSRSRASSRRARTASPPTTSASSATGILAGTSAARTGRIRVIDGTLPFWHGPRIAPALAALRSIVDG
jgi:hypothetical protein